MTTPEASPPLHVSSPPLLRRAAHRRPAGERRDAILRLADELESKGDVTLVSHRTVVDALNAYLDKSHRPDRS